FATSLFGQSVSEVGAGATEAFFKEVAGTSAILHVATHGITSAHDPAASHLLFQQEEQEGTEDGQLHAWEIYGMNIPADLTVLSACQTGTGALRTGTGVLSLARAFRYAGSKDVVMSLWSVNDRSTYQLMRHFFTEVQQEQGKAKALQNAMVRHLESEKDAALMHPYYWAGFSLVGPGELLNTGRNLSWWVLVGVITLVLGTGVLLRFKK
ncbi:MAG: CHAT domain-containing protein, partial [Bacteroidota bacterium]